MSRRRSGSGAAKTRRPARTTSSASAAPSAAPIPRQVSDDPTPADQADPAALVVTHWFDAGDGEQPYDAIVRLTGRRRGVTGRPRPDDTFTQDETIHGVIPGTGPVSLTAWVYGVQAGEWDIDARLVRGPAGAVAPRSARSVGPPVVRRARWSWGRWRIEDAPDEPLKTRWALLAPLAARPAVMPGAYTLLAVIGFVIALVLQGILLERQGIPFGEPLVVSLIAIAGGLGGAKAWYQVLHPTGSIIRGGWAVDGFLVVFPVVGAIVMVVFDVPIGTMFDATAPGLFFAVAIGRLGCFLTGCCAGRCTTSRWGVWSSDRRVGARRIPAQLFEAGLGLALGIGASALILTALVPWPGVIFLVTYGLYAVVRQGLLRVRSERRREYRTLPLTAAASVLVIVVVAAVGLMQGA